LLLINAFYEDSISATVLLTRVTTMGYVLLLV
jgi:hypothetical protein